MVSNLNISQLYVGYHPSTNHLDPNFLGHPSKNAGVSYSEGRFPKVVYM